MYRAAFFAAKRYYNVTNGQTARLRPCINYIGVEEKVLNIAVYEWKIHSLTSPPLPPQVGREPHSHTPPSTVHE